MKQLNLDVLLEQLQEIKKQHGGALPVYIELGGYECEVGYVEFEPDKDYPRVTIGEP